MVAGMREDGTVEVLGFCISTTEQCRELLEDLRRRGLEDVELFVSDDSTQPDSQILLLKPIILVIRHYKLLKERYATLALLARM